ncbi:MAG: hypothetical protein EBZ47_06225, partial [Chlamydiae bacterium]|nr:hypothetical protein [Chlamydiota bacterium]
MGKIVVFHSFQDGIGKTTLLSNLALELATQGKKIGLLDFDLQSPSLHVPFGISQNKIKNSMNDFLKNKVKLSEVPIEIIENHLYLFP